MVEEKNMIRHEQGELVYFSYSIFTPYQQIVSDVSSRKGGVSAQPFNLLHLALSVGDDPEAVMTNRERLCQMIGIEVDAMTIT